ncbi:hypothetical protein EV424DRAFT_1351199 [Suillus variegatus]|nr:hypothetical protein EV424DRAFT_1351199 [Suillus variegatus]
MYARWCRRRETRDGNGPEDPHAAEHMISNAPADPPVGSKSKLKEKPMRKKTLKVVASLDSDGIEIIDHVVATTDIGPDNHRGKGKQTALPNDVDGDMLVEVVKADTVIVRQRPMLKRKQTQPTGGRDTKSVVMDRKGKGKDVPPLVNNVDGDGSAPLRRKKSRESSQNEQLTGSMPSATRPLVSAHTSDQCKPWFEQPLALPATVDHKLNIGKRHKSIHWRTPSMEYIEDPSPDTTSDVAKESVVGTESININMEAVFTTYYRCLRGFAVIVIKIQQLLKTIRIRARETESEGIIMSLMPKHRPTFSGLAGFGCGFDGLASGY